MPIKLSLHGILTLVYGILLAGLIAWLFNPFAPVNRLAQLHYVGESAGRMMDRHLEFYAGYEKTHPLERSLHEFLFGSRQEVETEAIRAFSEVLQFFDKHPKAETPWARLNTHVRLCITLAETGHAAELEASLKNFGQTLEGEIIAEAIRYAYFDNVTPPSMTDLAIGARLLPLGWAADRLNIRLAQKTGNKRLEAFVTQRLEANGARLRANVLYLSIIVAVVCLLGGGLLLRQWGLPRISPWRGTILIQLWSFREGFAIAVRAALFGLVIAVALQLLASQYFRPGLLASWGTLFASLPMLWLIWRRLLKPRGLGFRQAFGLSVHEKGWRNLLNITLVFLAIDWLGSILISWAGWKLGLGGNWAEGVQERLVFGPTETVWLATINFVLWAAIFEEIGFRGLVYTTLRSRFNVTLAILVSTLIFSALHLYSLLGFLSVFWSGLVLAYVYERYHSLLPGMIIHIAGNLLNMSTVLLFYR
jgi:membrane protease YdiL (CAAX protease family)